MSVCNCKVEYIRPKYNNLKEWMDDPNNVYIARAGVVFIDNERFPKVASEFANPFKVGKDGTREDVIRKYNLYLLQILDDNLRAKLLAMKGKNLGCWCHPEPCHGDILLAFINYLSK
jgi:hypothetical protein